eukprot:symbB.v1.2.032635.t1/scaffold3944.1/size47797/2
MHGVKSVCAAAGAPAACSDRGDAFCCYSLSTAPLCDKAFLREKRPHRVKKCSNLQKRRQRCLRSFEVHKIQDPTDRYLIVGCGFDTGCVGRSSSTSEVACCEKRR